MQLLTPNPELVDIFNSFWPNPPAQLCMKLFEDGEEIDISDYIPQFSDYSTKDALINIHKNVLDFLEQINSTYSTRVNDVFKINQKLREIGILDKNTFKSFVSEGRLSLPEFVNLCKQATGKYTYSYATKVFSFIDPSRFPIIDSFVVTMLSEYDYEGDGKTLRTKWGDYSAFKANYDCFMRAFGLENYTYKQIDRFLWTYGKILSDYWSNMGVLSFESVAFDANTI